MIGQGMREHPTKPSDTETQESQGRHLQGGSLRVKNTNFNQFVSKKLIPKIPIKTLDPLGTEHGALELILLFGEKEKTIFVAQEEMEKKS